MRNRVFIRLAAAILVTVVTVGASLAPSSGAGAASQSASGPASTPHNDIAYIFNEFGLVQGDTRILKNIRTQLQSEGYRVTLLQDNTEGAGSPGNATLAKFEAMANAHPGIIVINTHGTDWTTSGKKCGGKSFTRIQGSSTPFVCPFPAATPPPPPPPETSLPVLQVQWFSSYASEMDAYRHDIAQKGFQADWLYAPDSFLEASTLISPRRGDDVNVTLGKNGTQTVGGFGYRPWIGLTSLGIAHFFKSAHVDFLNNWACHSMSLASSFHAASYAGYTDIACTSTEQPDQTTLWSSLFGLHGVTSRSTRGAFATGHFLDKDLKIQAGAKPLVLSPAVSSASPTAGTTVAAGSTVSASVSFDAKMMPSTSGVVVPNGCGATIDGSSTWNTARTKLSFTLKVPADAEPGPLTLTVSNTAALAVPGKYVHDRLDGAGLGTILSGVAPNRTNYNWSLECGPQNPSPPSNPGSTTPPNPLPTPEPTPPPLPPPTPVSGNGVTIRVQGNYTGTPFGFGSVTVSPDPPQSSGLSHTDGGSSCENLIETIEDCEVGGWFSPVTVTLTAEPIPEGTAGVPNDTYFVGWGGDCASFGKSPTCTLQLMGWDDVQAIFQGYTVTLG